MQNKNPEPSPDLLKRYLAGKCSREEEQVISRWYRSLGQDRKELELTPDEKKALKRKLWSSIRPYHQRNKYTRLVIWSGAAAACILLFLFFFQPGTKKSGNTQKQEERLIYRENKTDKTLCIVLPDTSLVWLQPSGSIAYTDFNENIQREITLSGEAFFDVTSNPEKPFTVYSGDVITRALGTKFNIKAYNGEKTVEVEVTEGRVEVLHQKEESKKQAGKNKLPNLQLNANEKVVYRLEEKVLLVRRQTLSDDALATIKSKEIPEKSWFEFNNTPLIKVVALLEMAYQIDIELENEALNHCTLTASLGDEALNTKLELICKSIGASYKREQNKVFISGDGCTT